jgi:hypothetical protein
MNAIETALMRDPVIRELCANFAATNREREAKAAAADPRAHKLSRVMNDTAYRYWRAGKDARGREVRFCYSSRRNVAGYFLGWREIASKAQTKRDQWCARKTRAACEEVARRRQNAWIDRARRDDATARERIAA